MHRRGLLVVLSGPAGSGKSSIAEGMIRQAEGEITRAITATTRQPRPGEVDGHDYFFITRQNFKEGITNHSFAEFNEFNANYYGTPRSELDRLLQQDKVVLLVVDINGAREIRTMYPTSVHIFVLPPTEEVLRERLSGRGTECVADVESRLAIAEREIECIEEYDHLVINDILAGAVEDALTIVGIARVSHIRGGELEAWRSGLYDNWHDARQSNER